MLDAEEADALVDAALDDLLHLRSLLKALQRVFVVLLQQRFSVPVHRVPAHRKRLLRNFLQRRKRSL